MGTGLAGQVVIVTGASSGIGRETALHFARERARLVLAARRQQRLQGLEHEIEALGTEVLSLPTDVAQQDQVEAMVERALERFGRVDILVNNAGVGLVALVEETSPEDMEMILRVNFLGAFYGIRAALPIMRRQGSGHIINVSSIVGKRGIPLSGAYCASKFALIGLSESLRLELKGSGIRVSVICPVGTATEFFDAAKDPRGRKPGPKPPVQTPSHVARAIIRCARSPRPEVIVYPPARLLVVLNALSPTLADWVIGIVTSRKA
ncbi:MAG: short-chain dehydrogenase/reductase SDR [candidate division NC10 bacterium CSP1-5]|nr:MAG: short-chain dehydrogenase/reductase SDR [candidate division NC10 bacterium CSP1-5]